MIPNTWKKYKLNEVVEIKYGKDHKHLLSGAIPVYGSGGIMRFADKALYDKESILIPRKGTLSNLFYVNKPFWSVDTMFWTKVDAGTNAKFLFYSLKTLDLASMDVGSAVPSLTSEVLNKIEITLPPLPEQQAIAEILSSLDDKMELNLQTNKTLEEMANALYKHWFVDFGPFKDGKFIESELGLIPEGWEVKRLEELVTKLGDGLHGTPKFSDDGEYYFVNGNNLSNGRIFIKDDTKRVSIEEYEKYKKDLNDRTLFVSINGTIGNIAAYGGEKIMLGKSACYFNIKEDVSKEFIKQVISSNYFINYIESAFTGSVIKNLSLKTMRELPIVLPPTSELQKFQNIVNSIACYQNELYTEGQTLKQTRDYLLPKLISGEIRVKEASIVVKDLI